MSKGFTFIPNPDELEFISDNIDSWTDWCRRNLERCKSNCKHKTIEKILFRLLLLLSGTLIFSISFLTTNLFVFIGSILLGGLMSTVASFSLYGLYKKYG